MLCFLYLPLEPGDVMETVPGQLARQFLHHVTEDHRVHVFTQHVKQEPIPHFAASHYQIYRLLFDESVPHPEQVDAHARRENYNHPVHDGHEGKQGEDYEPEPEEDVDLLVDDVEREDAHGVVFLQLAGDAVFEEGALGHPGEDLDHGIDAVLLVAVDELDDLDPEHEERAVEETVHEEHLP